MWWYIDPTAFMRASEASASVSPASSSTSASGGQPSILGKRGFDQTAPAAPASGAGEPAAKRPNVGVIRQAGNAKQVNNNIPISLIPPS